VVNGLKVIFLDVDGVLNSEVSREQERNNFDNWMEHEVSEMHVNNLKKIVDATGAQIVLSSSWRFDHPKATGRDFIADPLMKVLDRKLKAVGLDIIDVTPDLRGKIRGAEIQDWLDRHSEVERFVILDDDTDMLEEQKPFFVNTTFKCGLTEELAKKVIEILK
jgi:hypothetical protein